MNLITTAIPGEPIVVAYANMRFPDAIFSSAADAAVWCEQQAPFACPGESNPAVAICNGRLIRARDCFTKRHMLLALQEARRGKPVGEAFSG